MKAYKFEDFKVGAMEINGHKVNVEAVIHSSTNGNCGHQVKCSIDGGKVKLHQMSALCATLGVEYARIRKGTASGTNVVTHKSEEDRIRAKARVAFKSETAGLEALEAAGLLSGEALDEAKAALVAKIEAEEARLTAEAVAEKAKKAEEQAAKKAKKETSKKVGKVCELLDCFSASELKSLLKVYIGTREDAKAIMEVVTKQQVEA